VYSIHISKYVEIVYALPLLSQLASETLFKKSVAVRSVDYIYHRDAGLAVTGRIRHIEQNVSNLFKPEVAAAPVTAKSSLLSHSSRRPLLEI